MQTYDLIMLAVLLGATLLGFWKGMARQIASLASLVASYFVALHASPVVAPYIGQPEPLNRFIAMLLVYLLTSLAIWLVCRRVLQVIERMQLKEFDRQLGGLFGAAKGAVLCLAITFFTVTLSVHGRETVLASRSGHYLAKWMRQANAVMPKELDAVLNPYMRELEQKLKRAETTKPGSRFRAQRHHAATTPAASMRRTIGGLPRPAR